MVKAALTAALLYSLSRSATHTGKKRVECVGSLSLQRSQDKQQDPLKIELVIQKGKMYTCR